MAVVNPPIALQNAGSTHTAESLRTLSALMILARATNSMTPAGGVHLTLGSALGVTQQASPTTGVLVAAGMCLVAGTESTKQGAYVVVNDAAINVSMTAAPGSNSRIDTIVARVQDSAYSGASNTATIESVTGTASASPVPPTLPNNCLALADVLIPSGDTQYTNSQITDRRVYLPQSVYQAGGPGTGTGPSPAGFGTLRVRNDVMDLEIFNGTSWVTPGQSASWITFPFAAGYADAAAISSCYPAAYRVIGNRVEMRGAVRNTGSTNMAIGGNFTIGTMPVGARPGATALSFGVAQFGTANAPLVRREINSSGTVQMNALNTATWINLDGIEYYTS